MTNEITPFRTEGGRLSRNWVGRGEITEVYSEKLQIILEGEPARGMMILGMRGVGKTALLRKLQEIVDNQNRDMMTNFIDASQQEPVTDRLLGIVQGRIRQSTRLRMATHWLGWQAKKAVGFIFTWLYRFAIKELPKPTKFIDQFMQFGKELRRTHKHMVILIDELHVARDEDLRALAVVFKTIEIENLPILMVLAGHRILLRRFKEQGIDIEWLLEEHELHGLSHGETCTLLARTAQQHGKEFSSEALEESYRISRGYPHLVQLLGKQVWKEASTPVITIDEVRKATPGVRKTIGNNLYKSIRDKMSPAELEFTMAMASLPATARTRDKIYRIIGGVEADHVQTMDNLRLADVIYFPASNQVDFKAPLFDEYLMEHGQSPVTRASASVTTVDEN